MSDKTRTRILVVIVVILAMFSCCSCVGMFTALAQRDAPQRGTIAQVDGASSLGSGMTLDAAVTTVLPDPTQPAFAAAAHDVHDGSSAPAPAQPSTLAPRSGSPVSDLRALGEYAQAVKPVLDEGLAAAERDGQILKADEGQPELLCEPGGGRHPQLDADAALMHDLVRRLNAISPPPGARSSVHLPLTESARLWGAALDNINNSCTKGPVEAGVMRLGAAVQLGSSMLNFRLASDSFWRLALANGLEELVGPAPGN